MHISITNSDSTPKPEKLWFGTVSLKFLSLTLKCHSNFTVFQRRVSFYGQRRRFAKKVHQQKFLQFFRRFQICNRNEAFEKEFQNDNIVALKQLILMLQF